MMSISAKKLATLFCLVFILDSGLIFADSTPENSYRIGAPYDKELYDLAFTVFMGNSNLADALLVSEQALAASPEDREWRRRAAQVSEWSTKPSNALMHWTWLAEKGDREGMFNALRIARALNEFTIRRRLLEKVLIDGNGEPSLFREYLFVAEGAGLPDEALKFLSSGKLKLPPEQLFMEKARLAELTGRRSEAINSYQRLSQIRPLTAVEALRLASLWYGQGDSDKAWDTLRSASADIKSDADDFWRTYADLAWARQEEAEAERAISFLKNRGRMLEQDYQRLLLIYGESSPQKVFSTALEGWQRFKKPVFFYSVINSGIILGKIKELSIIVRSFSEEEQKALSSDGLSWVLISQVLHLNGDERGALKAAWFALMIEPGNPDIMLSYAWLLIDMKQIDELKIMVPRWEALLSSAPVMREPVAAAYMLLGESQKALIHFRFIAPDKQSDPTWMASYGDVLEQSGHPELAFSARLQAYRLLSRAVEKTEKNESKELHRLFQTRMQLYIHLAPGDKSSATAKMIAKGKERFDKELVIAWAMGSGATDLARLWYWKAFAREREKPEWALLGLALEENDRVAVTDLIEGGIERLPYRDAVEGARRVGMTPLAETHGFEKQQQNYNDHLIDQQVREMFNGRPGYLRLNTKLEDVGGVGFFDSRFTVSQPVTRAVYLMAAVSDREISTLKSGVTGIIPKRAVEGFAAGGFRFHEGDLKALLGVRDAGVAIYPFGSFTADYRPYCFMNLALDLQMNWRAEDTALLAVAGTKDRLLLTATGELTGKDSVALELAGSRFNDHWRNFLGNGLSADVTVRHQFTRAWPDYSARLYAGYHNYESSSGQLYAGTALMAPDDALKTPSLFIPASFWQMGAGISLGQTWKTTYTRDWKPFAEIDLGWMSTSNTGYRTSAGIIGPVFGLDQLKIELTHGSGRFGGTDMTTTIEFDYRYLF